MKKILLLCFLLVFFCTNQVALASNLSYIYDSNDRLKIIKANGVEIIEFKYDANGNLLETLYKEKLITPIITTIEKNSQNEVTLNWEPVPNNSKYQVYVNNQKHSIVSTNNITLTDLDPSMSYTIQVSTINSILESPKSKKVVIKTTLDRPLIINQELTDNSFHFRWEPISGAEEYQIFLNGNLYKNTKNTEETITNINTNILNYVEIVAKNTLTESGKSERTIISTIKDTYEPNGSIAEAFTIQPNRIVKSYISTIEDNDYYKLDNINLLSEKIQVNFYNPSTIAHEIKVLEVNELGIVKEKPTTFISNTLVFTTSTRNSYYVQITSQNTSTVIEPYQLSFQVVANSCDKFSCTDPVDPPTIESVEPISIENRQVSSLYHKKKQFTNYVYGGKIL